LVDVIVRWTRANISGQVCLFFLQSSFLTLNCPIFLPSRFLSFPQSLFSIVITETSFLWCSYSLCLHHRCYCVPIIPGLIIAVDDTQKLPLYTLMKTMYCQTNEIYNFLRYPKSSHKFLSRVLKFHNILGPRYQNVLFNL